MSSPFPSGRPRVWRESDPMSDLPREWGAYRFKDGRSTDYIGITSNIYNRISLHRSTEAYYDSRIHVVEYQIASNGATWDDLREWEISKIKQHSPSLVKYIGGNGRRPTIDVNGKIIEVDANESIEDTLVEHGFFNQLYSFVRSLIR